MTTERPPAGPFDAGAAWRRLLIGVALTVVGIAVALGAMVYLAGRPDWHRGYVAATVASVLAAGASLVPLAWGLRRGFAGLVPGFMASAGVRALVGVGLAAFAVAFGGYPAGPTLLMVMPYYLALLAVETWCLAKAAKAG